MSARLSFRAKMLAQLAQLRKLERSKSEARVAQSDARLKRADVARAKASERLADDEKTWGECLARADLTLTGAWAAQAAKSAQEHARLEREASSADEALTRARSDCGQAIARAQAVDKIARSAVKKLNFRREEARLMEIADREARRLRRRP